MRKFDTWSSVFFRPEWKRNWPFLFGVAITSPLITKMTIGFSEEEVKNSPFVKRHSRSR
ncbi:ATP synthase small subunit 6, mitochondrial-like [Cucumis melo]|uniref:ATP synthase small subunit 6, mitochondrial-like n=1 Tax=Cucumis melo TaxID=3656 RepID=A0ABM3L6K1_CUCME|nr:ATP synthase small subunit 6, mitochondrial-like [Cucumis melo]